MTSIRARACASWPSPGRVHHGGDRNGRVPRRIRDQAIFFGQPRCCGQLAGDDVGSRQVVERELQVYERARVASELNLGRGNGTPGFGVPQLDGDIGLHETTQGDGRSTGEPEPAAGFVVAGVASEEQLKCPAIGRDDHREPLCEPERDRVEQHVDRTWRVWARGCGTRRLVRLPYAAGSAQITGPHRGHE